MKKGNKDNANSIPRSQNVNTSGISCGCKFFEFREIQ